MVSKSDKLIFIAAILIALVAGCMANFTYDSSSEGGIRVEKQHSLIYETITTSYPASVNITNPGNSSSDIGIGVDTSTTEMDFGKIPAGGSLSRKYMIISNPSSSKARVMMEKSGSISQFLTFGKHDFILLPGESVNVSALVNASGASEGVYSGEISVLFRKPSSQFLEFLA